MQVRAALTALPGVLIRLRWLRNAESSYSEAFQSSYSSASISLEYQRLRKRRYDISVDEAAKSWLDQSNYHYMLIYISF